MDNINTKGIVSGILGFGVLIFFVLFFGSFRTVRAGHVGVVTRFGAVNRVVNPGFILKFPLIEGVYEMETRTQIEQVDASSASKDLQDVNTKIALNFHLRGEKAVDVYQNIGIEYKDRIIAPALQEAFKATTAQFTAADLIAKREAVKDLALTEIKMRLDKYNIIVDDLNIVNFDFSEDFNTAIEEKVKAQQKKEQAQIEAETLLIQAQGQSKAQAELKNSGALSSEYLQFLATTKWNGTLPLATNGLPFLNIPTR